MATTSTTLAAPMGKNDLYALLTSVAGVADKTFALIGNELCQVIGAPIGTQVLLRRGIDGGTWVAHASGEPVGLGTAGSDLTQPMPGDDTAYGPDSQAAPGLITQSFTASGAIPAIPGSVRLVGASVLAMTLALPNPMQSGVLTLQSTSGTAHTVTIAGWGVGSTHVITFPAYPTTVVLQASGGTWLPVALGGATVA